MGGMLSGETYNPGITKDEKIQAAKEEVLRVFREATETKKYAGPICGMIAPVVAEAVEQALKKVLE